MVQLVEIVFGYTFGIETLDYHLGIV